MSHSDFPVTTDGDSDPSVEIYGSDVDANASEEDSEEEEEEVEEEVEEDDEEEVEEEEEEEEVVEEEEEEEDDKGAVSASPADVNKGGKVVDLSQHMESEEQEEILRPVSSVAENHHEVMPPTSMHSMEENDAMFKASVHPCETLTLEKEDFHSKHEISSHPKSSKNLASAEDGKSKGLDVDIENAGSLLQSKTFGGCSEPSCNSKASLCGVKDMDWGTTKSSSDIGKDVDIGLLKRDCFVEDADGGQNSSDKIRKLEMEPRDDVKQTTSRLPGFPASDRRTRSLSPSAETKDGNKRGAIICDFFAQGWCIRGSSCRFLHVKDPVNNTGQEAEGDLVAANRKRELELEGGVGDKVEGSRMDGTPVPFTTSLERTSLLSSEFPLKQSMRNGQEESPSWHPSQEKRKLPLLSRENLSFENPYLPISQGSFTSRDSLFPENRFAFNTSSNYFSTNLSSYSTRAEGMASIRNQHIYNGYKSKITSYDWEPSVPFRPSFFITSMSISSPGDLYDPLRDSIEIPNIGDGSLKASLLIRGSSTQASSQVWTYGSAVVGKNMSDLNDEKSSVSSHNRFYENEPNKSWVPQEKDGVTETETTSGTYLNYQNGKMGTGQHTFGAEDITKAEKEWTERDARHHGEGSGHKGNRIDSFQIDDSVQKETKGLKTFRAVLVDLVKELLRPTWHEGRLSKDAHIMIVKKSVDKVLSTLEPHQIPTTVDTAKHYVSSCRVKIAKLVNGYINKYGKS